MTDSDSADSPIESTARSAGPAAAEAFELLGNETRLAILLALWDAYDPFADDDAVSFSDLRDRVGVADSGQFNYHLDRLDGHFVESTDAGYELRETGLTIVRAVIAGAGIEDPSLESAPIDMTCQLCGGDVEVRYEDEWVYNVCKDCEGLYTDGADGGSTGHLSKLSLHPAGLSDRSPGDIYAAAWVRGKQKLYNMIEGVCPSCSGPVDGRLTRCESHDAEGVCEDCGRHAEVAARFRCTVCKDWAVTTLGGVAKYHPAIVAFHHERDVPLQFGINDLDPINRRLEHSESDWNIVSADPLVVRVIVAVDGDETWLELDEDLNVVGLPDREA